MRSTNRTCVPLLGPLMSLGIHVHINLHTTKLIPSPLPVHSRDMYLVTIPTRINAMQLHSSMDSLTPKYCHQSIRGSQKCFSKGIFLKYRSSHKLVGMEVLPLYSSIGMCPLGWWPHFGVMNPPPWTWDCISFYRGVYLVFMYCI